MQIKHILTTSFTVCLLGACAIPVEKSAPKIVLKALTYPAAARGDHIHVYFGESVIDSYRWMEDQNSQEIAAFVKAQNELAIPYLEAIPARARAAKRIDELWSYERFRIPVSEGGRYFYRRNDGTQDQDVLYVTEDLAGAGPLTPWCTEKANHCMQFKLDGFVKIG